MNLLLPRFRDHQGDTDCSSDPGNGCCRYQRRQRTFFGGVVTKRCEVDDSEPLCNLHFAVTPLVVTEENSFIEYL